ncbi:MAG: exodeoxyribonuclease III [Anaerolineales bacterium]|nr:exodeoxyribonuclease III [Anaerolineales bacterium]MCX7609114.1 exodeoxyribonuclease III [Anaerolineales bacterium]MDW8227088.1 exodeoxyribonuclease III [Anaerolineales bacterium]
MALWKLISWNVNGIRAAEKKGFLDWLASSDADVVAVQETKAHPSQLSATLLQPPGYQSAWSAAERKGYSGVGTYTRRSALQIREGLGDPRFDHEGRVLIHEFEPFVFFNIYFPNGGRGPQWVAHKLAFYKKFLEVAREYMRVGRPLVVAGDFNTAYAEIDLARPKENSNTSGFLPEERQGLGEFFSAGLIDTFRLLHPDTVKYTWWDMVTRARERNVGWRIDYFMVSPDLKDCIRAADIHDDVIGSDHCPISLVLEV